jgi:hypothetical protein
MEEDEINLRAKQGVVAAKLVLQCLELNKVPAEIGISSLSLALQTAALALNITPREFKEYMKEVTETYKYQCQTTGL